MQVENVESIKYTGPLFILSLPSSDDKITKNGNIDKERMNFVLRDLTLKTRCDHWMDRRIVQSSISDIVFDERKELKTYL